MSRRRVRHSANAAEIGAAESAGTYREGDWLWIPLRQSGQYAVGRIARVGPRGKIITVYAFGLPRTSMPTASELESMHASSAAMVRMCGDLGIINGEWKVIAHQESFDRAAWPMPAFGQWSDPDSPGVRVDYPADAPNTSPIATIVTYEEARQLPRDGIDGYEAFELHLCMALGVPDATPEMDRNQPMTAEHYTYFSTERVAKSAAKQMLRAVPGGTAEVRRSDDEWLVMISHRPLEDRIGFDDVVDRLTRIAAQRHGSYDGWERDA